MDTDNEKRSGIKRTENSKHIFIIKLSSILPFTKTNCLLLFFKLRLKKNRREWKKLAELRTPQRGRGKTNFWKKYFSMLKTFFINRFSVKNKHRNRCRFNVCNSHKAPCLGESHIKALLIRQESKEKERSRQRHGKIHDDEEQMRCLHLICSWWIYTSNYAKRCVFE